MFSATRSRQRESEYFCIIFQKYNTTHVSNADRQDTYKYYTSRDNITSNFRENSEPNLALKNKRNEPEPDWRTWRLLKIAF